MSERSLRLRLDTNGFACLHLASKVCLVFALLDLQFHVVIHAEVLQDHSDEQVGQHKVSHDKHEDEVDRNIPTERAYELVHRNTPVLASEHNVTSQE